MSRDFETEYQALATEEAPDLWNRIEAGLTIKPVENKDAAQRTKKAEKGTIRKFVKRYRPALIAAACVLVILPTVILMGQGNIGGAKNHFEEAADEEAAEIEIAETCETTGAVQASTESAPETDECQTEDAVDMKDAEAESAPAELSNGAEEPMRAEGVMQDMAEKRQSSASGEAFLDTVEKLELQDGSVIENVTITVNKEAMTEETMTEKKATEEAVGEDTQALPGVCYLVEIKKDPGGILKEGEQILLFVPEGSGGALEQSRAENETAYEVDIEYDSRREYVFCLKKGTVIF